ncbi:Hypothetical_protein [Hexamita inflata]|uniref:Hypothetical_protein n=1 Tax=Hexamita inflata TaxID=28002 RepID=A0AA86R2M4_9EUKA|nr:Hypothetical protein HINF_LOCUS55707 [Hexamita inflata]
MLKTCHLITRIIVCIITCGIVAITIYAILDLLPLMRQPNIQVASPNYIKIPINVSYSTLDKLSYKFYSNIFDMRAMNIATYQNSIKQPSIYFFSKYQYEQFFKTAVSIVIDKATGAPKYAIVNLDESTSELCLQSSIFSISGCWLKLGFTNMFKVIFPIMMYITAGIALFCILLLLITFKCFNKEKIVQNKPNKPSTPTPKQRSNANSQQKELILNNENQSYSKDTKPTPNQSQKVNRTEPKLKEINQK